MEHRRADAQVETGRPDRPDTSAAEDHVIRKKMNEASKQSAERAVRATAAGFNGRFSAEGVR
jgi:hypothetical protein